ncbi:enoyl-CoA hydratase/isomerase family protein [Pedomonas sp. V897]|uniref:enoyl-CoA hydratase/isomerase family protein n=1 Tax=Pedomonas sp. V897 TaxID=3446482 RepID=UPI003EE12D0E
MTEPRAESLSTVMVRREDDTVVVTLNCPPDNALDRVALAALTRTVRQLGETPPAGGLVLTGAGAAFCSGLSGPCVAALSPEGREELRRSFHALVETLQQLETAVVAAVNGHTHGCGLILALTADVRLFADQPESRFGLMDAAGEVLFPELALALVERELGPVAVRRLSLTETPFSFAEALSLGLAESCVAPEALLDAAVARARSLVAQPGFLALKSLLKS